MYVEWGALTHQPAQVIYLSVRGKACGEEGIIQENATKCQLL